MIKFILFIQHMKDPKQWFFIFLIVSIIGIGGGISMLNDVWHPIFAAILLFIGVCSSLFFILFTIIRWKELLK
jgi:hypothetical protein